MVSEFFGKHYNTAICSKGEVLPCTRNIGF